MFKSINASKVSESKFIGSDAKNHITYKLKWQGMGVSVVAIIIIMCFISRGRGGEKFLFIQNFDCRSLGVAFDEDLKVIG